MLSGSLFMRRKIFIILLSIVFIGASFTSVSSIKIRTSFMIGPREAPMPGDLIDGKMPEFPPFEKLVETSHHELYPIETNDFVVSLIEQLDEELYLSYLEELVSFGPRVTNTEECNNAGDYIYNEFVDMGLDVRKHEWESGSYSGFNVEATLPGFNEESDEIYIICGHYDTVPGSPGADDDGSGVVAVMTAAKLMSSYLTEHTVRFITFSGEEQGLRGSYEYVVDAYENDDNIAGVLNADMIGYAVNEEDDDYVIIYRDTNDPDEWLTDYTVNIASEYQPYINLEIIPGGRSSGSDHYPFWQAGYSAVFFAEYNFNPYWHTSKDKIEYMDISYAVRNSKLILATLSELTGITEIKAPLKPVIISGPDEGKFGEEYTYTAKTTDPQNDQVYYLWDWGDGTDSGWIGPYNSGAECEASNTWIGEGDYNIKVKAKDSEDHESEWSNPFPITMPKNTIKKIIQTRFSYLIEILREKLIAFANI
jgi:hypothetical protein